MPSQRVTCAHTHTRCPLPATLFLLSTAIALAWLPGTSTIGRAAVLEARYDPVTGNITLIAFDDNGDPGSIAVQSFWLLSDPPKLTGEAANMPPGSDPTFSTTNTDNGIYGVGSEINAANFSSTALFSETWNLGNVAATGMSLSDITASFTTDPESTPGGDAIPGGYLYFVVGDAEYSIGTITVVPEPTALALTACGLVIFFAGGARRAARRAQLADAQMDPA